METISEISKTGMITTGILLFIYWQIRNVLNILKGIDEARRDPIQYGRNTGK